MGTATEAACTSLCVVTSCSTDPKPRQPNSPATASARATSGIHDSHQADCFALLRQLVIDAGVVASEGAYADHSHVNEVVSQFSILRDQEVFFATFAVSFANFAVKSF